ncbi:glucosamine-6-phosphate deaminase [Spiroplasma clarkii]|uniref:Glucosamine-6-phosphate deaminase n=1 Tax=Spiroplasma clarkii TaxID=2139 RepID=A0A2K8KI57_9MOLU|nr:glucosamine-6-phosphate deaminase [Spiroplasma clarkii]ATX71378.1 glucosamine-6-phosphate deaminase [Spiroplasma clarkii]
MELVILKDDKEIAKKVGDIIIDLVKTNKAAVLGLATGSSPESTYQYVIEKTAAEKIDWKEVVTFNLDEYIGLSETDEQSYCYYMNKKLFENININIKNTFVPSGLVKNDLEAQKYDEEIKKHGGIDLQILGIGTNGHIGFNEPKTSFDSLTRIVDLTPSTIAANARFFDNEADVPKQAVSMGLKSIMNAKKIILIAMGATKAEAIKALIEGNQSTEWPCTVLQDHSDILVVVDEAAASLLS